MGQTSGSSRERGTGAARAAGPTSGRGGDAEDLGAILRRVMRDVRPSQPKRRDAILEAWQRAAGAELAAEARPSGLRKGVLTVEVRSSALLHEIEGFRKDELLSRFLAAAPEGRVTGLRFRLGVF